MKIFISGSSGFVGKNLVDYLKSLNDYEVLGRSLRGVQSLELTDVSSVVHLAGKAHDTRNTSNPEEYYKINFDLSRLVFNSFLKSDAKVFIMLSSVKACADQVSGVLTEEDPPHPQTHYGKSKLLAEEYILAHKLPMEKKVFILRPCMIHGEGNKGNLNLLYNFQKKGVPYPLGRYYNERSYLGIENLCFIISELISREDIDSGIYNVADDEVISTRDLISLMYLVENQKPKIWSIPKFVISGLAKFGDLIPFPINSERLDKLTENYRVSNMKIKKALGKEFPLTTREGLVQTIKSFNK